MTHPHESPQGEAVQGEAVQGESPQGESPQGEAAQDVAALGESRQLRSPKLMPLTTVVNLWMGPGLALALMVVVVASLSLIAVRVDLSIVWGVIRPILPFVLIATSAVSLGLSIAHRPMRGTEHTVSTLAVLVPWVVVLVFLRPLPIVPAAISVVLCLVALLFARPKRFGDVDGVEAGGYQLPRSEFSGKLLRATGTGLLIVSAAVYVGWLVQALIDPRGLTEYFGGVTVESIRLRGGGSPSALAVSIAGFYGNLLVGAILIFAGRRAARGGATARVEKAAVGTPDADGATELVPVLQSTYFRVVGGWFVLNAALSLIITAVVGLDFIVKTFYLMHMSLAWIALCTWLLGRRGKDALLILGVFLGVFSLLIVLGIDLALSFFIAL